MTHCTPLAGSPRGAPDAVPGRRWRGAKILHFSDWDLPDVDVCDDFLGDPDEPEEATGEAIGFVIETTAAEVTVAIPLD